MSSTGTAAETSNNDGSRANEGRFTSDASEEAIQEAQRWAGQTVTVGGVGGFICVDSQNKFAVKTSFRQATPLKIEPVDEALYGRGLVAFRVLCDGEKYLTVCPYGDDVRNEAATALAQNSPLLPVHIVDIVNFVADEASAEGNFEGAGFNYRPITVTNGPPTWLQVFELENQGLDRYGIKSRFGTYWRSQHWNKTVSQSPHCLGDERWRLGQG